MPRHVREAHSSLSTATAAFKSERLSHNTHSERSHFSSKPGEHRSGPSSGSPTHPTDHQHKISPLQDLSDFVPTFFKGSPRILWPCATTESVRCPLPDQYFVVCVVVLQCTFIRVHRRVDRARQTVFHQSAEDGSTSTADSYQDNAGTEVPPKVISV